jgi:hypothetical protein
LSDRLTHCPGRAIGPSHERLTKTCQT